MLKVIFILVDFNAAETCSDFCTLCFRISKQSNKSEDWPCQTKSKLKQHPLVVVEYSVYLTFIWD